MFNPGAAHLSNRPRIWSYKEAERIPLPDQDWKNIWESGVGIAHPPLPKSSQAVECRPRTRVQTMESSSCLSVVSRSPSPPRRRRRLFDFAQVCNTLLISPSLPLSQLPRRLPDWQPYLMVMNVPTEMSPFRHFSLPLIDVADSLPQFRNLNRNFGKCTAG